MAINTRGVVGQHEGEVYRYATLDYARLGRILDTLRPSADDAFLDLGCGMGRMVCLCARRQLRRVEGVEINEALAARADRNAAHAHGLRSPVKIFCSDATQHPLEDQSLIYMFNPFGPTIMRTVIDNVVRDLLDRGRSVRIAYAFPRHEDVILDSGRFEKYEVLRDGKSGERALATSFFRSR